MYHKIIEGHGKLVFEVFQLVEFSWKIRSEICTTNLKRRVIHLYNNKKRQEEKKKKANNKKARRAHVQLGKVR